MLQYNIKAFKKSKPKKKKKVIYCTSLVVQWLRIHLAMQRTLVRSRIQENPICHIVSKPVRHNY